MAFIEEINENSISVRCNCGELFEQSTEHYNPEFNEEFQQYENITTEPCPNCNLQHIFNMNLPETELDEQELEEEPYFPAGEKERREKVREIMWKIRSDLKGKNRQAVIRQKLRKLQERFPNVTLAKIREIMKERQRKRANGEDIE